MNRPKRLSPRYLIAVLRTQIASCSINGYAATAIWLTDLADKLVLDHSFFQEVLVELLEADPHPGVETLPLLQAVGDDAREALSPTIPRTKTEGAKEAAGTLRRYVEDAGRDHRLHIVETVSRNGRDHDFFYPATLVPTSTLKFLLARVDELETQEVAV